MPDKYSVSHEALAQAQYLGLCDAGSEVVLKKLKAMLEESAPTTNPEGNRRYHDWVFDIQEGVVVSLGYDPLCATCGGCSHIVVYDDALVEDSISNIGTTRREIPCPTCNIDQYL